MINLLFLNTQYSNYNNESILYDISFIVTEVINKNNRYIKYSKNILKPIIEKHIIIKEFEFLIPSNKDHLYGFANYTIMSFKDAVNLISIICNSYKPNIIYGNDLQLSFQIIKNTQKILNTNDELDMNNYRIPSYTLFKKNISIGFEKSKKYNITDYILEKSEKFVKQYFDFALEHKLFTNTGFISKSIIHLYNFTINNLNIELQNICQYDNMYIIEIISKSISLDKLESEETFFESQNKRKFPILYQINNKSIKI